MPDPFPPAGAPRVPRLDAPRVYSVAKRGSQHDVRLAVVIPSYNTARYVVAAARSILAQSVRELDVIVVDDGSHDDSVARLLQLDDHRLTVVRQQNRGLAGARNTGILLARAPLIGFCDSDDLWHPHKAERHLAIMENAADIGVTFSFSAYLHETGMATGQLLTSACAEPTVRELVRRNHLGNGSTAIVRRRCFEDVGLFDESMTNVEEWELWVRIAACTRHRIVRVPAALTGYRIRTNSLSVSYDSFLRNGWTAVQRFHRYVPGFTARQAQRAYAEVLRIASRKAYATGDIESSRKFLWQAALRCPTMFLGNPRAVAMVMIHAASRMLPRRWCMLPYNALQRFSRTSYRFIHKAGRPAVW